MDTFTKVGMFSYFMYFCSMFSRYVEERDPVSFKWYVSYHNASAWISGMRYELDSMYHNYVWDLVELTNGVLR